MLRLVTTEMVRQQMAATVALLFRRTSESQPSKAMYSDLTFGTLKRFHPSKHLDVALHSCPFVPLSRPSLELCTGAADFLSKMCTQSTSDRVKLQVRHHIQGQM